jgi:hypothetical protein
MENLIDQPTRVQSDGYASPKLHPIFTSESIDRLGVL